MSDTAHATSYALTDSWTMTRRELARWARQPVAVAVNLAFPVMMLLMFGYLVGGGRGVSGDYLDYLIPGMLALTMAFGLEGTMVAVTRDLERGVVDRFRSLPMTNGAVLVGRSAADMLQSVLGLAVLLAVGYALGWRAHGSAGAFLGAVGLLLLFRFAMLWVGIHLALVAGKPEMVQAVQILVWPVGFLSNAFAAPRRCRAGWARSSSGTRCPRPPPPCATCSAAPAARAVTWGRRWCGRWSSWRCSSRWRCAASPG